MKSCLILMVAFCVALCCCPPARASLSGRILNEAGGGISGARVFAEPGIEGAVVEGAVEADGHFRVEGDFYGNVGIIAFAPGYGYGGAHLNVSAAGDFADTVITLFPGTTVSGTVRDAGGAPVANARLASLAITHPVKVGVPLFKMGQFGRTVPASDADGTFVLEDVPRGATVALKFEHAFYAQEAVPDVKAGDTNLHVVMHRGVSLRGLVTIRGTDTPVSGALVTARNAQPPHDTAFSNTDGTGAFRTLLKPGVYMVQAHAAGRISPGMQRVVLQGDAPEQQVRLALSSKGVVTGTLHDAKSGTPIRGARVLLETRGQPAGAARTGRDGRFRMDAPEGVNTLHFEGIEGYLPPDTRALRITVPGGGELELPGFWLAPIPDYTLRIYESDGETPVPGAFISLLWPRQFGWQRSDRTGRLAVRFSALPEDNRIIGFAEHPQQPHGALFALEQRHADDAAVVLLPLAEVSGRVVNADGDPLAGVTVGALYADEDSADALALWRCVTDADGRFSWPSAPAGVPQRCVAMLGVAQAEYQRDFNPAPGERIDLGTIALAVDGEPDVSAHAQWKGANLLCGPGADRETGAGTVAFHCRGVDGPRYLDAIEAIGEHLHAYNFEAVLVVTEPFECDTARMPVYQEHSALLSTRLYDAAGRLRLEFMGLPPVRALHQLSTE